MQKKIHFDSDGYRIHGILHLPSMDNPSVVIGSHGLFSSGDSPKQIALAQACTANGMAYFRFDHRGCGNSSGIFSSATTFGGRCRDLIRAIETILDLPETGKLIGLFGSSFGGAVSLAVSHLFNVKAIVTVAAPVSLNSIIVPDFSDPADKSRLESLNKEALFFDITGRLSDISNILIFHGDKDKVVPFSNAVEIYQRSKKPKQLIRQTNGDHSMSGRIHQEEFIHLSGKWYKNAFHLT